MPQLTLEQAIAEIQAALRLQPNDPIAHDRLGLLLRAAGRLQEAVRCHQTAISLDPSNATAHSRLGNVLGDLGRHEEAFHCHRRAAELAPASAEAYYNLGVAFQRRHQRDDAEACYRRAIAMRPDFPEAHFNLGDVLYQNGRFEESEACFRRALELRPDDPEAHNGLGGVFIAVGRLREALEYMRRALAIRPDYIKAHSSLLLYLHYDAQLAPETIFAEHLQWARQHATGPMRQIRPHLNNRDPHRRLRIGYISPDFRRHSVSFFFEPLLASRNRGDFETVCYSNAHRPDAVTQRLRGLADGWRQIAGLPAEQVAAMIRSDAIDILVDLAGHTADNSLPALARKPAPVQMTYLGYPNTTGLPTVDYRITDASTDPPGTTESLHTEQLLRLDGCFLCYRPGEDAPEVAELPAKRCGHVTFGCFNNIAKLTPSLLATWASMLLDVPHSRLLLKSRALATTAVRQRILADLERQGIESARVELLGYDSAYREHLEQYARVDIALDTFPYSGATTTCEALWMGVPVVSFAGRTHMSRVGCSLLHAVGLPQLIAQSEQEYGRIARALAMDLDGLAILRATLRQRMRQSPLMDAAAFTRGVEAAYRQAWSKWCQSGT